MIFGSGAGVGVGGVGGGVGVGVGDDFGACVDGDGVAVAVGVCVGVGVGVGTGVVLALVCWCYCRGFRVVVAVLPHHHLSCGRGRHGRHRTIRPLRTAPCRRRVRHASFSGNPCRIWGRGRWRGGGDWSPRGGLVWTHASL